MLCEDNGGKGFLKKEIRNRDRYSKKLYGAPEQEDQNHHVPAEMVAEHRLRGRHGPGIPQPDPGLYRARRARRRPGLRRLRRPGTRSVLMIAEWGLESAE